MIHRFADFELDTASLTLRKYGGPVDLPRKAVELLSILVDRADTVVTKSELMDALWPEGFVEESNLTQHVYLLRRAFAKHGAAGFIKTAPRRGYCFSAPAPVQPIASRRFQPMHLFGALAASLVLTVAASSGMRTTPPPLGAQAAHAYSLGQYFWNLRSISGMQRSIGYFREVVQLAPHSALGYAALADAYTELADFEMPCTRCTAWRGSAERAASQALAADASSAEAHVAYAMVRRVFYSDETVAAREFRIALQLDPQNALANQWYGNLLIAQGSIAQGVQRLLLASQAEPVATATYAWLARGYYYEGHYAEASHYARQALALEPTRLETTVLLGLAEEAGGDFRAALSAFERARELGAASADVQALRAGLRAAMGKRTAVAALRRLAERYDIDIYTARDVIIGLAVAGDVRDARQRLSRIRYRTALDRELTIRDPHIRALL
jgi:DNA-binding winged helix-turn-helix (wHTH) protein/Tfp pilus assembly protein PilF